MAENETSRIGDELTRLANAVLQSRAQRMQDWMLTHYLLAHGDNCTIPLLELFTIYMCQDSMGWKISCVCGEKLEDGFDCGKAATS